MKDTIAVLGLGYVGLPLLAALARKFDGVIGFDIDSKRIQSLIQGHDWTGEIEDKALEGCKAVFSDKPSCMLEASFIIVTVPTPIDQAKRPDLSPVLSACDTIAEVLKKKKKGGPVPLIVFESTVYPGLTEEICGRVIEEKSGLKRGKDFKLGYSPERINPGDKVHTLERIQKIISAEDEESLDRMEIVYGAVITAGLHKASSIRVAECAKVIENTQRDINIALMNELAIICEKMDLRTHDVLQAAGTKWNFLPFTPGLVGGHCIGVDPYYLTERAKELGYHPQVILAGRQINDNMPVFVAQKIMKLLVTGKRLRPSARIGILGLSFKENVRDLRNSRVPDIVSELSSFGVETLVYDPVVDPQHAHHEYGITLCAREDLNNLDVLVLAVTHDILLEEAPSLIANLPQGALVIDIKSALDPASIPSHLVYWSL
ncbi:MAG: nucleotide sugar dehydrogenase [Alphaproteobacteria bacterium]|nr:nucleotide sugar dehydrogenase [Alphaproteobacteria bacterium]